MTAGPVEVGMRHVWWALLQRLQTLRAFKTDSNQAGIESGQWEGSPADLADG